MNQQAGDGANDLMSCIALRARPALHKQAGDYYNCAPQQRDGACWLSSSGECGAQATEKLCHSSTPICLALLYADRYITIGIANTQAQACGLVQTCAGDDRVS